MPSTIKDIREETGLSLATISKYLNGGNVLPENRVKIEAAVKKLHYEVNEMARGLVTNSTRTIGVSVFNVADVFNSMIIGTIGLELSRRGYGMLVVDAGNSLKREEENIKFLVSKKVDGIIALPASTNSSTMKDAFKANIPIVLIDRRFSDRSVNSVTIDNREAARSAVDHLIQNGHRKIAIIGGNEAYTAKERIRGYMDAIRDAGYEVRNDYIFCGEQSIVHGYESMNKILAMQDRPTAVFSANYEMNLGAVMALNESELNYPEDISIVGFDNLLLSKVLRTRLTVVEQPMEKFGVKSVEILMQEIQESKKKDYEPAEDSVNITLGTHLLIGNSVKKIG